MAFSTYRFVPNEIFCRGVNGLIDGNPPGAHGGGRAALVKCMVLALGLTIGWQFTGYNLMKNKKWGRTMTRSWRPHRPLQALCRRLERWDVVIPAEWSLSSPGGIAGSFPELFEPFDHCASLAAGLWGVGFCGPSVGSQPCPHLWKSLGTMQGAMVWEARGQRESVISLG